jgi:Fe-S-cluster containining protein
MSASQPPVPSLLAHQTDRWFQRAAAALLGKVPCEAGCSGCCIGPFPITLLDRRSIREGMSTLPEGTRQTIEARAREQANAMESVYPQLARSRFIDAWPDSTIDRLVDHFHQSPCPALGNDGLCILYDYRPLTCRSMGIPTEHAGVVNGACEVQTFIPIVRLSAPLQAEEYELARREAQALEACQSVERAEGEEMLLAYGFLPMEKFRQRAQKDSPA